MSLIGYPVARMRDALLRSPDLASICANPPSTLRASTVGAIHYAIDSVKGEDDEMQSNNTFSKAVKCLEKADFWRLVFNWGKARPQDRHGCHR
ncbi:MAG: hypothetical protein C4583_15825 [Anaerolineaceae bacterium]|nr:MAG: hypothetical protein C4583_15825 [Anaerolineaceae bacterium]